MSVTRSLFRLVRLVGDVKAISKGRYGRRLARRVVHRRTNRLTRRLLRRIGL